MLVVDRQTALAPSRQAPPNLPPSIQQFLGRFARYLATARSGPESGRLLAFFMPDAALIPHHDGAPPQEGMGSLRTYLRHNAGRYRGAAIRIDDLRQVKADAVLIRATLQTPTSSLKVIAHIRRRQRDDDDSINGSGWAFGHLWLRESAESADDDPEDDQALAIFSAGTEQIA